MILFDMCSMNRAALTVINTTLSLSPTLSFPILSSPTSSPLALLRSPSPSLSYLDYAHHVIYSLPYNWRLTPISSQNTAVHLGRLPRWVASSREPLGETVFLTKGLHDSSSKTPYASRPRRICANGGVDPWERARVRPWPGGGVGDAEATGNAECLYRE